MTSSKALFAASVAAALLSASAGFSATIVNGGFEQDAGAAQDGDQFNSLATGSGNGSWSVFTTLPGWTTTSGAGIEIQTDNTVGQIDAHGGEHYVELDSNNNSTMQQTINLLKGFYELTFFYSPRTEDPKTNTIEFSVAKAFGDLASILSDSIRGPNQTLMTQVGTWTEVKATFEVKTAGTYTLAFEATGTNDSFGGFIDDVSLAPVPLPAGGLLLIGALGGLAALRRRSLV